MKILYAGTLSANDSAQAIVFNVPRNTNPFPVSGKYIRNVSGKIVVDGGPNPGTRTFTRRIEVDFPADANTNVTLFSDVSTGRIR